MHSYGDHFVVLLKFVEEQTEQRRRELESSRQELEILLDKITNFEEVQFPSFCYFDTATGAYNHENSQCPVNKNLASTLTCPFEDFDKAQHNLRNLELRELLTLCFHNPKYAKEQYILSGLAQESSIYKYS